MSGSGLLRSGNDGVLCGLCLLRLCLFKDFLLRLSNESFLLVASLLLFSALSDTDLLLFLSRCPTLSRLDATLSTELLLLLLVLTLLALTLHFLLAVALGLLLLLTVLSLVPVVFFEVLVLLWGRKTLKVCVDLVRNEALFEADVDNLVIVEESLVVLPT